MSEFRSFLGRVIDPGIAPRFDGACLPLCTRDECPKYDGKRCVALGFKPARFCEPALVDIVQRLREEIEE